MDEQLATHSKKMQAVLNEKDKQIKVSHSRKFFFFQINEDFTYDKELFAVKFDSEDAHDSDKKGEEGASISRCPESQIQNSFSSKFSYIDFVSRPSSRFGVMQARTPGRTAKMI